MATSFEQFGIIFDNIIKNLDANISTGIPGTDLWFKRNAIAQVASNITNDLDILSNNIFPSSAFGPFLDKHALSTGLTPRRSALPASGSCTLANSDTATSEFTIDQNTSLTSSVTGNTYYTTSAVKVLVGTVINTVELFIKSTFTGASTSSTGTLTLDSTIIVDAIQITTANIVEMNSGSNLELDSELATRIYNYEHFPRGAGSISDYNRWSYSASDDVTQAFTIKSTEEPTANTTAILFPIILGGSTNPDYYIDGDNDNSYAETPYPIDRRLSTDIISTVQDYIDIVKGVNANPIVITGSTYLFNGTDTGILEVYVSLTAGLTLDTVINFPENEGGTKTVRELIQREIRRSIISTPITGQTVAITTSYSNKYIPVSQIENAVLTALNNRNTVQGTYISILTGLFIRYMEGTTASYYILLPNTTDGTLIIEPTSEYFTADVVYDIDVDNAITIFNQAQP